MSAAAERTWWGRKKLDEKPKQPVKNVVLHLKRIISWQKLLWIGIVLGWVCIAISLRQASGFGLAQAAQAETWVKVATVFTFCLFIICAHISAYYIGLNYSAGRHLNVFLMGCILLIGEGISIYTSTAMFMNETFTGIQAEVDNSPRGQALMGIANARAKAAGGQLDRLGETNSDYVSVTDKAAQAQYRQLDQATAEVNQATDASSLSPLQKSLDKMEEKTHVSPFAWALAKAFFLTLFPLSMTIMLSNLNGKRNLTIDIDEGEEVSPKKG